MKPPKLLSSSISLICSLLALSVNAASCKNLPTAQELRDLLIEVESQTVENPTPNGGRAHHNWLTLVDGAGFVCAVVTSTPDGKDITNDTTVGLGHREASARKAYTASVWSKSTGAIASGNLFFASLSGVAGSFYASPMALSDPNNIYGRPGDIKRWGTNKDPMIGKVIGGFFPHAGGLALFDSTKKKAGAIGISGDSNCTNHVIAWKMRERLRNGAYASANIPTGVAELVGGYKDQLIQDIVSLDPANPIHTEFDSMGLNGTPIKSLSGFGYPLCPLNPTQANDGGSIFRPPS